jgi:tRNA A-37 threonylcarbamoyl transferase component Bud32
VDKRYELYCLADRLFYDSPARSKLDEGDFALASRPLPEGWNQFAMGEWVVCIPAAGMARTQGWKIHVSGCLHNAADMLEFVWEYCVDREIPFKYLRGKSTLLMRNAKYAQRGGSGKFITIYPANDAELEVISSQLSGLLEGQPGPYILSDLRYGEGPLYVRYGGFTERYCEDDSGELVAAIEDATGRLIPDRRTPVFSIPDWVELPAFLVPHLEARKAVTIADLPYRIEEALHFSNGGGVYSAIDTRTGDKVVLKEARPYAGLAADGADAVARLRRERDILRHLDGIPAVPRVRDYFECGGHHFLVQEFIEGRPLNSFYAERYPLVTADPGPEALGAYTGWALRICAGVEDAVRQIHGRGVVFNDLHMFNVMIRPDDSVALLDFEVAAHVDEGRRPTIGNPGFVAPRDRTGFDIDRYSLACLRLAMFMPLTTLFSLDRGKVTHLAGIIGELFPVPAGYLADAVREITRSTPAQASRAAAAESTAAAREPSGAPRFTADADDLEEARRSLRRAIGASATPEREDRLFPGDIKQFAGEALGIAHGAAGVLYALSVTGDWFPEYEEWLISRAMPPAPGAKLGLYDGLLGIACVLCELGRVQEALKLSEICLGERWERLGTGLYGGIAGYALGLLYLGDATRVPALSEAGARAAEITANRMAQPHLAGDAPRAGLMRGAAGPALLFVRMYERTGDPGYLDLAAVLLDRELDACVTDNRGALVVDEGWRTLPYLGDGSAGIGLVAEDYLRHRDNDRFAAAVPMIRKAARSRFYSQSGLLAGRAGMILYLSRRQPPGNAVADPDVAAQIRWLGWHAISYADGVAFPGDQLFRLSMDLATGTAGVMLGLHSALSPAGADLPFVGPLTSLHHRDSGFPGHEGRR